MVYKKVSPRPLNIDINKMNIIRKLFVIDLIQIIAKSDIYISIDEWTINRATFKHYGWTKIDDDQSIISIIFQDSFKIIAAIFSNGTYFVKISNENTTSDYFCEFITDLNKHIKSKAYFFKKNMIALLDNARVHKTSAAISKMTTVFENVSFLLAYTPQFAPVELFFAMIKCKIRSFTFDKSINYRAEKLKEMLKNKIKEVSPSMIIKSFAKTLDQMWKLMYSSVCEAKSSIID